jgi:N-acetylmuramoyl-L-alanine amidase
MVSKPPMQTAPRSPNFGYHNGFTHRPEAVCWHITQGQSSLGWLTNPASGASSNYLIDRDGTIHELVPPNQSAWANGAVNDPDLANPVIAGWEREGCNYNQRTISIENEGYTKYWAPGALTAVQTESLIALTAWLCDSLGIPPTRTCVIRHQQIDNVDRYNCPGFSEEQEMLPWIGRVADLCGGTGGDEVKEPAAGTADQYLNEHGNLIAVVNFGGTATAVLGVNYADIGGSVRNKAGEEYDISLKQGVMGQWVKRPGT